MTKDTYRYGKFAENVAKWFLRLKGWRVLEQRWSCYAGEIDIIAKRGTMVIFVEVKARKDLATALDALGEGQWHRINEAADFYMAKHPHLADCSWRYDAICITPYALPKHFSGIWYP